MARLEERLKVTSDWVNGSESWSRSYVCVLVGVELASELLNTELLGRSERRSTSDVDVGGAEFSGRDIL